MRDLSQPVAWETGCRCKQNQVQGAPAPLRTLRVALATALFHLSNVWGNKAQCLCPRRLTVPSM